MHSMHAATNCQALGPIICNILLAGHSWNILYICYIVLRKQTRVKLINKWPNWMASGRKWSTACEMNGDKDKEWDRERERVRRREHTLSFIHTAHAHTHIVGISRESWVHFCFWEQNKLRSLFCTYFNLFAAAVVRFPLCLLICIFNEPIRRLLLTTTEPQPIWSKRIQFADTH